MDQKTNEDVLVEPLHCVIADIPQSMLVDIVQTIAEQDDTLRVVDRVTDIAQLPAILDHRNIDVLIIGMQDFILPKTCDDILKRFSDLLIVGLVDDGRKAAVYFNDIRSDEISGIISALGRR